MLLLLLLQWIVCLLCGVLSTDSIVGILMVCSNDIYRYYEERTDERGRFSSKRSEYRGLRTILSYLTS